LQPYISYGVSVSTYSAKNTAADGTVKPYNEKTNTSDIGG
jgi:hypothetical protein